MNNEYEEAPLSQLGLAPYDCYQFGSLFRELAAYMTQLSSRRISEEESDERQKELLAKKSLIGLVAPTKPEIQQCLIESLTSDLRSLELKKLQLELLKAGIEADISNTLAEIAKLEAIIEYIQHN